MAQLSPMMQQYMDIKAQNEDSILFFRVGDFYEMFFEDAKTASEELDIVLTGNVTGIPQCKEKFDEFNTLGYGVNFVIPERSGFATAIGAALIGSEA